MPILLKKFVFLLSLGVVSVLAQDSTSASDILTIQTSPPEPVSSTSSFASSSASASNATSISGTTSAPSSTASVSSASFPGNCAGECTDISNALASCGAGDALNTTCLCTPLVEANYVSCLQCGLSLTPSDSERQVYQAILDSYINQCASAPLSPISLPNMTITLPLSSASGSSSGSASNSVSTTSTSSSASTSSGVSDTIVYPSSSISRVPLTSTITASASSTPSSPGGNSGSSRRISNENAMMSIGLAGVVGVVFAAAAI
ncbi:uncharacterized protein I303_100509 [Kwoniella dejecticola CBS 10117]|uniref:Extracellular membrane protein CFEM domain-containing protein n=1 Tax=Kwoniella dejecticola CBS 10117 TaxID=1296121 RepID=A0A1A6AF40_9TREE|nr:uncharacterized protein I303_00509 [Kwoniella dejecticola CBS 10117]OBR88692.1 hypothetical protein I303_00509 [Kwoniella dejecticola CBS 10117]